MGACACTLRVELLFRGVLTYYVSFNYIGECGFGGSQRGPGGEARTARVTEAKGPNAAADEPRGVQRAHQVQYLSEHVLDLAPRRIEPLRSVRIRGVGAAPPNAAAACCFPDDRPDASIEPAGRRKAAAIRRCYGSSCRPLDVGVTGLVRDQRVDLERTKISGPRTCDSAAPEDLSPAIPKTESSARSWLSLFGKPVVSIRP